MKKLFLITIVLLHFIFSAYAQQNVQITNCLNGTSSYDFSVGGSLYRPLVCNYLIEFLQDATGAWYISPSRQYTTNGHMVGSIWTWDYDPNNAANSVIIAKNKLISDLARIKSLGFTEIRLIGAGMINTGTSSTPLYKYPTGSQATYFSLLNLFFTQLNTANLRVIFLLGGGAEYFQNNNTTYKNFISSVAANFSSNHTIMAYDLMNEPQNSLFPTGPDNKYNLSKLVNEWNDCVKKNDPNHLTTIGLQAPWDLYAYDPLLMKIDFVSYHSYPSTYTNITAANNIINTYYYWAGKTINMPWIIGETSYSAIANSSIANVGVEADQLLFAQHTLQKSVDCNCKGYSWWQYQEVGWGIPAEDHMGLFYRHSGTTEGGPKQVAYPSANPNPSPFLLYNGLTQNTSNCPKPSNYYTVLNGATIKNQGYVKDNNNNPIINAVVQGKDAVYGNFITFTDATGYFKLGTGGQNIIGISVSYPGYSNAYKSYPTLGNSYNFILKKVNNNSWAKQWSNSSDASNTISNNWIFSTSDKFYKGDFNGDGQEDLLCAKYTNSSATNDRMAIYTYTGTFNQNGSYYNISSSWTLLWDNQSSSSNGGGIYPYRNNLVVGDFNGDKKDDVISLNSGIAWSTWFTFSPNANPTSASWNWMDSDYGTSGNPMSAMKPYSTKVIAGDFYHQNKAAIMGVSGNWLTTFQLINNVWTWVQSNQGQTNTPTLGYELSYLTPYITQLIAGDFDGDGYKEVLGNALPNGAMALFKPTWNNTNYVWKWTNSSSSPYWIDATNNSGMYPYRNNLLVGNFDSDNSEEILGFNSSFCVAFNYGNWTNNNCTMAWDGSNYSTISDWNIGPAAYKYLFMKTTQNTVNNQQELLAIRNNSGIFAANLYAFRPNPQSTWPCSTLRLASNNKTNSETSNDMEDNIVLYPNPSEGKFTVSLPKTFNQNALLINIFDIQGKEVYNYNLINDESNKTLKINLDNVISGIYFLKIITPTKSYTKKVVIL